MTAAIPIVLKVDPAVLLPSRGSVGSTKRAPTPPARRRAVRGLSAVDDHATYRGRSCKRTSSVASWRSPARNRRHDPLVQVSGGRRLEAARTLAGWAGGATALWCFLRLLTPAVGRDGAGHSRPSAMRRSTADVFQYPLATGRASGGNAGAACRRVPTSAPSGTGRPWCRSTRVRFARCRARPSHQRAVRQHAWF